MQRIVLILPPTNIASQQYYFVVVKNDSKNAGCDSVISNIVSITINDNPTVVGTNGFNFNNTYCLNDGSNQYIYVQGFAGGVINGNVPTIQSYQWYQRIANTNIFKNVNSNTSTKDSLLIPTNTLGTQQYYVKIFNNNGCYDSSNLSCLITINNPPTIISSQLNSITKCQNYVGDTLRVFGAANYSYQWYVNNVNSTIGGIYF